MNLNWLNKKNNNKLIVFFNGWGMDDNAVRHLDTEDFDVLTVCDYNTLEPLPDLSMYLKKYIVAWSMGVMIATNYEIGQISATAINGTPFPINLEYGINPKVYKLMELGFNENSREKFVAKMFNSSEEIFNVTQRPVDSQKTELTALKNYLPNTDYKFSRVIVADNDNIIPTKSQLNYWETPETINGGHYIFHNYKKWKELL